MFQKLSWNTIKVFVTLLTMVLTLNASFYAVNVDKSGVFDNTYADAYPQTIVAHTVEQHFREPLPAGKTVKKAIIIGYDGARCDAIPFLQDMPDSGVFKLAAQGGLYISFAGGEGLFRRQATSTAPGWASILTGDWANVHKVRNNGIIKSNNSLTVLTRLVEDGNASSSAFLGAWGGHFLDEKGTYRAEVAYTEERNLPVSWEHYSWDDTMHTALLAYVQSPACPGILFNSYERPDSAGHGHGFDPAIPEYMEALRSTDRDAFELITAIEARPTFAAEDWLIIATSDHGGKGTGHGRQNADSRMTFIASNKPIAR